MIASEVRLGKDALLSGEDATDLRELLERRDVLVFPRIGFTDEEQVAFTRTLGTFVPKMRGEEIYNVTLDTRTNAGAAAGVEAPFGAQVAGAGLHGASRVSG